MRRASARRHAESVLPKTSRACSAAVALAGLLLVAATDTEAGAVYYSVGTSVADLKSGAPTVTISSGVATFSVAQPNNVGVGDQVTYNGATIAYISGRTSSTQHTLTTATGGVPANIAGATVNQIRRAFNSLTAAEAGSSDAAHLNTANLVAANVQLNWACYNDGPMNDQVTISGYVTGASNYIRVFTPVSAGQVGTSQRHRGKARTGFRLQPTGAVDKDSIVVNDSFVRIEGIEIDGSLSTAPNGAGGVDIETGATSPVGHYVSHNIIYATRNFTGIYVNATSARVSNNVLHKVDNVTFGALAMNQAAGTAWFYNNTVFNHAGSGIALVAGTLVARNNVSMNKGSGSDFAGAITQSNNVSGDASAAGAGSQVNKTAYASYFRNTTLGSEDLHLVAGSAALWGSSGADLSADADLPVTDDIDGERRLAPDIGADEFLVCCNLSTAEVVGSTLTVTGANQFEMVFRQAAGASLDSFFDLAEDPTRSYDLAGHPASEFRGLFHSSIVSGGLLYVTGQNSNGPQLDLLEATPTRVRTRSATFYQRRPSSGSSAILPGIKAIVDYSVYPSGRLGVHWNRRITTNVSYTDHPLELAVHYEAPADPRSSLVGYSQSGATFPAPASDAFALARFDAAGARTDFLAVMSQPWPAADSLDFSGSPSPYFFSWRDVTPTTLTAAANPSDSWNFLAYVKPTNLVDNADGAVTSRSADYLTPSSITLLKGQRWLDGTQNTGGSDDYNEAEGAYVLGMDPSPGQGLQFRIDGTLANPRYSPFFKIRKWRSFVESPTVTLDGTPLVKSASYRANVKPLARAHWASTLSWHCTMESTSACDSANLDVGAGVGVSTTGTSAVAGRYGNGLLITANTDKVVASSSDFSPSIGAIEFWYQPRYDSSDGLRYLLWYAQGGAASFNCYALEKTTGNTLLFWVRINATNNLCTTGGFSTYSASVSVAAGTAFAWRPYDWVHLKASWNSAGGTRKLRIAVNGVEAAISGTFVAPGGSSTPSFGGCAANCPVNSPGHPNGILDEVHIYGGLELGGYDTNTPIAHAGLTSDAAEYLADTSKNRSLGLTPVGVSRQGSYFYFGADSPFLGLNVGLQTPGAWSTTPGDLVWEYWDGVKWRSLESGFNFTDTTSQLTQTGTLYWDDPSTWTPYSVNGGPDLYYVRVHLAAGVLSYSTQPVERLIETDILLFQYCGNITAAGREFNFAVPAPTAVKLASFTATPGDASVLLAWRTASELDNLGFWLYRGLSQDGPWTRLNASLIPGLGSSAVGQRYSLLDSGLQNGATYYYRLEDVDAASRVTSHGPVSTVPSAGGGTVDEGDTGSGAAKEEKGAATGSCPDWVLSAYGSSVGSSSTTSLTCTRHGDPEAVSLGVVLRDSRSATLELRTGGFYALHTLSRAGEASGGVRVFIPGFDFPQDPQAAALPFRRALVDAVVGRRVQLGGVRALDPVGFPGLVPSALGKAEMQVSWDGTVRAGRRGVRALAPGRVSTDLVKLLPSVFQGETKSAVVEISPLRFDARRRQLVLAKRVRVQLLFTGREVGESGRASRGRRAPGSRKPVSGEVLARLYTTRLGLHAVSFEQLFPGRRRGMAASTLRLERQGEAVGFHIEPASDSFGPGSRLYFHADTAAKSTDFSSETAFELLNARDGVQLALVSAAPAGEAVSSPSTGQASFETNRFYQPGLLEAPEPWLWEGLASGASRTVSFALSGVASSASQPAELELFLQGASESGSAIDHHVSVAVNGVAVGEVQFAGKKPCRMSLSLPLSLLREGVNELGLTNVPDTGVSSYVFLDRFTVSYPQLSSLAGGVFEGTWSEAGTVTLSGVAGSVALLDVTAMPAWLGGYEATGGSVRFKAEAGHRYLAVSDPGLVTPRVAPPEASTLRSATNQADYLLIAPRAFLTAAEPLVARRQDQSLTVRAVAFEEIADTFGHGQPSAEAIRSFLAFAYHSWTAPSPRYALLLGDSSYDPRNFSGTAQPSPLPALWTKTSYLWTVSDPELAAVNGEDSLPDLAIGRLPATSVAEAHALVQKLLAWEDSGQGLSGRAALVADNPDLAGDFEADIDDIAASFMQGRDVSTLKLSALGGGTRAAIREALDSGLGLLSYVGHGGAAVWASENVWNSWDAASLLAQSRQPLLVTMNCLNGYFVAPAYNSLAESLLKAEGRGAIAGFSPSGLSLDGPAHQYHRALVAELTSGQHERLGDALLAAQAAYARTGLMPELLAVYHLLGDPATRIR